jgi:hypothetical protein
MYCLALILSIITLLLSLAAFTLRLIKKNHKPSDQSKNKLCASLSNLRFSLVCISLYIPNEFSNQFYLIVLLCSSRYNSPFKDVIRTLLAKGFEFLIILILLNNSLQAQKNIHTLNFYPPTSNTLNCIQKFNILQ